MSNWRDPTFRYSDSVETSQPGYLRRKFAQYRREQEQAKKTLAAEEAALKGKVARIREGKR